jgi:hypothetical protein
VPVRDQAQVRVPAQVRVRDQAQVPVRAQVRVPVQARGEPVQRMLERLRALVTLPARAA